MRRKPCEGLKGAAAKPEDRPYASPPGRLLRAYFAFGCACFRHRHRTSDAPPRRASQPRTQASKATAIMMAA